MPKSGVGEGNKQIRKNEHDKAVESLGSLLGYYKLRMPDDLYFADPTVTKQIAISVKEEKAKRVTKSLLTAPRGLE